MERPATQLMAVRRRDLERRWEMFGRVIWFMMGCGWRAALTTAGKIKMGERKKREEVEGASVIYERSCSSRKHCREQ
jgi:hypothetical protein